MFTREEKIKYMRSLMWDYDISPEECLEVLEGTRKTAGHYNEKTLFSKLLESFRWFTVMQILPLSRIADLLTEDVIRSLRFQSLKSSYEFVRKRLSRSL